MTNMVDERAIIFSAPMVRAILAGRKTITRRILQPHAQRFRPAPGEPDGIGLRHVEGVPWPRVMIGDVLTQQEIRYRVGQRLWVREAWADVNTESGPALLYRADGNYHWCEQDAYPVEYERYPGCVFATWGPDLLRGTDGRWRSPIHMPRWASRITLEVAAVKVERLQDINTADALAEGALEATEIPYVGAMTCDQARIAFSLLWDTLHGKTGPHSWEANPEVVAISFKRVP